MKKIILALSVLSSTVIMAQTVTPVGKLGNVSAYPSSALLNFSKAHANSDGCSHALASTHAIIPFSATGSGKAMFSVALSAYVSGKNVRVITDGCIGGLPQVLRMDIMP